jgi:hypothetical protein
MQLPVKKKRQLPQSSQQNLKVKNYVITYFTGFYNPLAGFSLLSRGFENTHNDTTQSVGLLWTSDRPVAETGL